MRRVFLPVIFASVLLAQSPEDLFEKAPPHIDQALRARITEFYQAHVDGKFRQADQLVAEDSKDFFFAAEKKRLRSFEIVKITYSDNFTKAKVLVAGETDLLLPGVGLKVVKVPFGSLWKVVDGHWFWYVEPRNSRQTPFGEMKQGPGAGAAPAGIPKMPDVTQILEQVKLDKSAVQLRPDKPSEDSIVVSNQMPGVVSLSLDYQKVPGLEIQIDKTELKSGDKARVTFRYDPTGTTPRETAASLTVKPLGRVFHVRVMYGDSN